MPERQRVPAEHSVELLDHQTLLEELPVSTRFHHHPESLLQMISVDQ